MASKRITVIVLEDDRRAELIFENIDGDRMEFNSKDRVLVLPVKGSLLNEQWVVPFVSHYCVQNELEW
ncbi:hypothetical protein SEA_WOFFORD_259 [Streptomyces phage Wofford]|uniref:Uncharacterized protein n=1 Tax=Streptomyces phage Wofford TaxID=2283267 RepID=A0A345MA72_9CAUD|nr:hypothetical protein HWB78_gp001 [Streptomyces phage Wollford]YP_009839902.1 hypothetical protein HWB78_gp060 [Streptomyces phage Wollford]AXH67199.1 hypothetical protein SEA_WOFFORD_1 [Streptomyces phage Wollford]AXH67393.1 hypothetical protein SEA_WOFFORD_259 [Streptomyces phage Wollford]